MCFATPVIRQVALIEVPSTKEALRQYVFAFRADSRGLCLRQIIICKLTLHQIIYDIKSVCN